MMSKRRFLVFTLLLAAALSACRSQPIPLSARAGSSFTVFLVGEVGAGTSWLGRTRNNIGFGGTENHDQGITDVQRGEVQFFLSDGTGETGWQFLETQLVTRVFPDPASNVGLSNGLAIWPLPNLEMGQVMAIIYIPTNVTPSMTPGDYTLWARKIMRDPPLPDGSQSPVYVVLEMLKYQEAFTVLGPAVDEKTPPSASFGGYASNDTLGNLYPYPKVLIQLPVDPLPSAAHLVITVPPFTKTVMMGVFEEQHFGRQSMILADLDATTTKLTIDFVNAEATPTVHMLAIAYKPGANYVRIDDQNVLGAPNPLSANFTIDTAESKFWDIDGVEITGVAASLGPIR